MSDIDLHARHQGEWVETARAAVRAGDALSAAKASMRAQAITPEDDAGVRTAALSALHLGRHAAAIKLIRWLHILAPHERRFLMRLLEAYIQVKNPPRAIAVARRILVADPPNAEALQRLGRATALSGERAATLRAFRHMLWSTGGDAPIFEALMRACFSVDRFGEALHWANRAIDARGATADLLFSRGRAERMLGRTDAASRSFDEAVSIDGSYAGKRALVELTLVESDFRLSDTD